MRSLVLAALSLIGLPVSAQAAPQARPPIVLELFTSQGCSSCPPADELLQRLAREGGVLVLSRPVTYWDDLGWKDTLALPENTSKQRAYQANLSGRPGVYTPQLVIDGRWGGVGSDERAIRNAMRAAQAKPPLANVKAARLPGGKLSVTVTGGAGADVLLVGYAPSSEVAIWRGENGGTRVIYTNVVRGEARLGKAGAEAKTFEADLAKLSAKGATRFAILVQQGSAGAILGAADLG